jgi:L-ascorbate metabolism protein UlaG (beta-lactamase superfamily)
MELIFNWIGGATFVLRIGNLNIACDPVLCDKGTIQDFFWFKSQRIEQPVYSENDFENIDLLIPNMGAAKQGSWIMTLTLNSEMLKKMIVKLNPKIVIPVHYGTFEHYKEPVDFIKEINDNRILIVEPGSKTEVKITDSNY